MERVHKLHERSETPPMFAPTPEPSSISTPTIPVSPNAQSEAPSLQTIQRQAISAANHHEPSQEFTTDLRSRLGQGQPLPTDTRNRLEPGLGWNFANINVHDDNSADRLSQQIQARAFTTGNDVFFRSGAYQPNSDEGLQLIAHELGHVVQRHEENVHVPIQTSGVALGQADDRYERDAEARANRALKLQPRGASVQTQPPPRSTVGSQASEGALTIQRFGSDEHVQIGTAASGGANTDIVLDDGSHLTYGQMVAMGDFFGNLDEMRRLGTTPAGQAELRWVRWFALHNGDEPNIPDDRKRFHRNHYYELAANNISHFSAGGSARNEYGTYHQQALAAAFMAGVNGDAAKFSEAMTIEAFGNHFLTDMFSGGHIRTPRREMREWYQTNYGRSIEQLVEYMAGWITLRIDQMGGIPGVLPNFVVRSRIQTQVRELGGAALNAYSLGDIVSLAYHDHDNRGLGVISDVDPSGHVVSGGFRWTAMGDNHLADGEDGNNGSFTPAAPLSQASVTRQMSLLPCKPQLPNLSWHEHGATRRVEFHVRALARNKLNHTPER